MDYHIARDGQQPGVFSESQVQEQLKNGTCRPTDLAWCEGMADWQPLSELFPSSEAEKALPSAQSPPVMPVVLPSTAPKNSGLAIASLVCGILSFFTCGLTALPGVICGHLALARIKRSPESMGGKGLAIAGLATSYCLFLLAVLSFFVGLALPVFAQVREKGRQTQTVNHAKQIALACMDYAQDHEGKLPDDLEILLSEGRITDEILRDPLLRDDTQIGFEYYGAGRKDEDNADVIILRSKRADSRGRKVVARIDGSVEVEGSPADH